MSHRSGQYAEYPQHHSHDRGRAVQQRRSPVGHPAPAPATSQSDYTLVHAGRQVRIGPDVF